MASLSHDSQRLLVAYVNKERAAQQADNQLLLQIERDKEQAVADKVGHIYELRVARLAARIEGNIPTPTSTLSVIYCIYFLLPVTSGVWEDPSTWRGLSVSLESSLWR